MPFFRNPTAFRHLLQNPLVRTAGQDSTRAIVPIPMRMVSGSPHSSHPSLPHLTLLVFEAVLEVICVSLPGYLAARHGFFNSEMQKFTANLNVALFTPCLIFVKLASKLTADKLADLAIIPAIFVVQTLVSWLCAILVSKALRLSKRPRNFVVAMGVFGNSNSLPISLVISLSQTISGLHWDKLPGDNDEEVQARGILYLLIFQQLGQLVRWSWGYNVLLAPPDKTQGTSSHERSQMENGIMGAVNENTRLIDMSDSESENESPTSQNCTRQSGHSPMGGETPSTRTSGDQTPVTYQQHPSSIFSTPESLSKGSKSPLASGGPGSLPDDMMGAKLTQDVHPKHRGPDSRTRIKSCTDLPSRWLACITQRTSEGLRRTCALIAGMSSGFFHSLPPLVQGALRGAGQNLLKAGRAAWGFMNPPLWAMLGAIVVASIPELQRIFFTDGTFVKNSVTSAIDQNAGVAVPLILVVLGGNLARSTSAQDQENEDDDIDDRGVKLLIAALISRMLLPFLIMAPILALTAKYVPISIFDDPIFVIVCFLITGAPSALQLAQICQINNVYMKTMSRLLFQSYVVWILPSTLLLVMCALEVVEWAKEM